MPALIFESSREEENLQGLEFEFLSPSQKSFDRSSVQQCKTSMILKLFEARQEVDKMPIKQLELFDSRFKPKPKISCRFEGMSETTLFSLAQIEFSRVVLPAILSSDFLKEYQDVYVSRYIESFSSLENLSEKSQQKVTSQLKQLALTAFWETIWNGGLVDVIASKGIKGEADPVSQDSRSNSESGEPANPRSNVGSHE
ncbi:MAG: hypothetical protein QUS07_07170 [Methanothrix sp.]|nr:hypothetical protein [Methanothrix sp.]